MVPDSSVMSSNRMRIHGQKLNTQIPHQHENFYILRVAEDWNRLHREVMESPFQKTFKIRLDMFLCYLL